MLGNRLLTAASLVQGKTFLDIGTDHALLPIWLISQHKIEFAYAGDVNPKPLAKGKQNARHAEVSDKMRFFLSDGFSAVDFSFDCAAICGMGGILITEILQKAGEIAHVPLVLQPMTGAEKLRKYLWENGFRIRTERFTLEDENPYVIFSVVWDGKKRKYDYIDLYLGKSRPETPEFDAYRKKMRTAALKRLKGALCRGTDNSGENVRAELLALIQACETPFLSQTY